MPRGARLRELMDRRALDAVLMRRPENFAWHTGGGNSRVEYASPEGVADVLVTPEGEYVVTSSIEAPRMREEETPEHSVIEYPWHEGPEQAVRELAGAGTLGADVAIAGAVDVSEELATLRRVLDEAEVERLREIGADLTEALGAAAAVVAPGMTEHEAAALIAAECRRRGLVATVLLAAADDRIASYRHPIPAGAVIQRRAMLVASAQRGGLYANLTRIVELEESDREVELRVAACDQILARMRDEATRPGRTLAQAFDDCRGFYADAGFPEEWRLHHQGGMTGYASREVIATPQTREVIEPGQAFAWNPSVTGAKAEETFVLTDSGPEVVAGATVLGA